MVNLDNISFIEDSHGKKAVILSLDSYTKIKEQLEELEDIKSYIEAKSHQDEILPFDVVESLIESKEHKIRIIRKYRGLSVTELAGKASITESYLSQIENGKRKGTIGIFKQLAKVLNIDVELLI